MRFLRGKGCAGGRAACALAMVLVLGAPPEAQRTPPALESVLAEPRTAAELRRRLNGLDAAELPRLFQLAAEGRLPGRDGDALPPLHDEQRQIVREALAARPRRELVPLLEDLASRPQSLSARLEAQRLLGGIGSGDHMKLLTRLTVPVQERGAVAPELRAGFSAALEAILARDAAALAHLPALFSESPPGLASPIVEALASVDSQAATRTLASLLGRSPGIDPLLLARLADRGPLRTGDDESVFDAVRRYLRQRDPALAAGAACASGRLEDDGAVEGLVVLIEGPDQRVRASAFEALERISGLSLGDDPARWTSWYNAEMRWWEEEADALLVRIERGHGLEFVRAAREVLEHRLFRDRIAESFIIALAHRSEEDVVLACAALQQLRSHRAVPGLIECLERDDPVRAAALRALRAITGLELPPRADSWAELGA